MLVLIGATACAFALFTAMPGAGKSASRQLSPPASTNSVDSETYEGMVTDTHCGAKHSAAINMSASDCTRACVHAGEQFALIDGDTVYKLHGEPESLKRLAGQRVRIVGSLSGNMISVTSVAVF